MEEPHGGEHACVGVGLGGMGGGGGLKKFVRGDRGGKEKFFLKFKENGRIF